MTVTDIKEYRVKGKYEIYLNDEFAFILYKSEIKKYNIDIGAEILSDTYDEILDNVLLKRAKKRAMNLLLKGDIPEKKLRDKLSENMYPISCIDKTIEFVKGYHYIDDARYTRNYIGLNSATRSRQVIRNKLIEKGIDKSIIDEQLISYYEEDSLNAGIEEQLLRKLLIKKLKGRISLEYNEKQKVFASIYRKGFSINHIDKVYNEYIESLC